MARLRMGRPVAVLFCGFLAGCSSAIVHDLDEGEANQILALLQQNGISAEKLRSSEGTRASYTLRVSRGQTESAWRLLQRENLPRPRPPGVSELFGKPGLLPTATQERTLAHHALSGELARTLQGIEGVLEARVHLVLPARDPLMPADAATPPARAAVLLRLAASGAAVARDEVQRLVAGAVDGLLPGAVTVVMARSSGPAPGRGAAAAAELARLGPFWVGSGSRTALRAVLVGGVTLLLLLCLTIILLVRRQRDLLRRSQLALDAPALPPSSLESSLGLLSRSLAAPPSSRPATQGTQSRARGEPPPPR